MKIIVFVFFSLFLCSAGWSQEAEDNWKSPIDKYFEDKKSRQQKEVNKYVIDLMEQEKYTR